VGDWYQYDSGRRTIDNLKQNNKNMKCVFKNVEIKSIATCLPEKVVEMSSYSDKFGEKVVQETINGSGIERLHIATDGETTGDLCQRAAELIFEKENFDRNTIDGVIFVSQTFDYYNPATSCVLQGKLGLSKDCVCFDISYGCSGYINGIFQAASLISSGACNTVLVMAGDTNSKMHKTENKSSVMVFGDAGSATIVSRGDSNLAFHIMTNGYDYKTVIRDDLGFRKWPQNHYAGYESEEPPMQGDDVFSFIVSVGPRTIKSVLELAGWDKDEVDFYGLHQATKITVDFMRRKLKLAHPERAPFDIQNYGNTGPTTVPMVLTDWPYRSESVDTSTWHKVVLAAYGVGLSWGSIACDLSKTKIYRPINQ
jgi:3-oxoacyl-[acyl-carrier-protein] synthase-3